MYRYLPTLIIASFVLIIIGCDSSGSNSSAKWTIDITLDNENYKYDGKFLNDSSGLNEFWSSSEGSRANFVNNAISINFGGDENSENHLKGNSIYGTLGLSNQSTGKQMATLNIPMIPYYVKGEIEVNVSNLGTVTSSSGGDLTYGNEIIINIPSVTFLDSITGITRTLSGRIKSVRVN